jgi:hypothetical protein
MCVYLGAGGCVMVEQGWMDTKKHSAAFDGASDGVLTEKIWATGRTGRVQTNKSNAVDVE